jgi:hypothetical protein
MNLFLVALSALSVTGSPSPATVAFVKSEATETTATQPPIVVRCAARYEKEPLSGSGW